MYARGSNVYKQSNKQFISNVRQLREIKESKKQVKTKKGDFEKILEDPDAEEQETLLDPRDRYNG